MIIAKLHAERDIDYEEWANEVIALCNQVRKVLNKGLVVSDKEYIGHTPDGVNSYPHREVLEVKVIFTKKTIASTSARAFGSQVPKGSLACLRCSPYVLYLCMQ
jgi:hypothetical protein